MSDKFKHNSFISINPSTPPLNPSELENAVQRLHNYFKLTERHEDVLTDLFVVLSAAKRTASLEQERDEFSLKIIELACNGTDSNRFDSVAEMQIAMLHKWWRKSKKDHEQLELLAEKMYEGLKEVESLDGDYGTSMQNSKYCPCCHSTFWKTGEIVHYPHCKIQDALTLAQQHGIGKDKK